MIEFLEILVHPEVIYLKRNFKSYRQRILESFSESNKRVLEDIFKKLQRVLKEPLKYFKDPSYSYLAIESLKGSSVELYVEVVDYYFPSKYYLITKDSIKTKLRQDICEKVKKDFYDPLPF